MNSTVGFLLTVLLLGAPATPEDELRARLRAQTTGEIILPPGAVELSRPLELAPNAIGLTVRAHASGSVLRAAAGFTGPALLIAHSAHSLRIENVEFDGRRDLLEKPRAPLPDDTAVADHFPASGLWIADGDGVTLTQLHFQRVVSFPILVTRGHDIQIDGALVEDSGGHNTKSRNNTTGGILFEEGTANFRVRNSRFLRVLGNAVWTHSWYRSPRASHGLIAGNTFEEIARDAVQIGHATDVIVEHNTAHRIGFPIAAVDIEGQGIPAVIDTAGNVDRTLYRQNQMTEVNGKCFDLDGFHDGEITGNTCRNQQPASAYPTGHYGIVFNNTNPDMKSEGVLVENNEISGMRFGGIFVIGERHRILNNKLLNLNTAHCNDTKLIQCLYVPAEPDMLRAGIYLGLRAERPAPARQIEIRGNSLSGYGIAAHCIVRAPGLPPDAAQLNANTCLAK